ncbi:GGDEF and EAL domain proteins [plant metagenome]|uniref:GGDEF and EAL domain proteins n=1 Tax=plant metagenome TaxID=1297885 RepID=A0A484PTU9_9ZZZZ
MGLLRDLTLSVATVVVVVACGSFALGLHTVHSFLEESLTHRTRAEAALLTRRLGELGASDAVPLLDQVFDAYGYRQLSLRAAEGDTVFEASRPAAAGQAPQWFERLVPLAVPPVTLAVPTGPYQGAMLSLSADDKPGRDRLWQGAKSLGQLAAATLACALLIAILTRRLLARTLSSLGRTVQQWTERGNGTKHPLPPELQPVGAAIDQLQAQARARIAQHTQTIETLQEELEVDPITRLPNRKRFLAALHQAVLPRVTGEETVSAHGHVVLFRQRDLASINQHMPRQLTDQWLRGVTDRVQGLLPGAGTQALLGRLNGSDFGLLLPSMEPADALRLSEQLRIALRGCRVAIDEAGALCRWALTLTAYTSADTPARILARLDHGLMRSESAGEETIAASSPRPPAFASASGEYAWKDTLLTALDQHRFSLATSRRELQDGTLLRHEASLTLHDPRNEQAVPAQTFIPAAIRLGLASDCDIQAVRLALDWLTPDRGELATLLSLASLGQSRFLPRLQQMLEDRPAQAARLLLEIDAHGLVDHYADVRSLCDLATATGVRIGLRRLTRQFGAMAHLHHLPLSYIKLDADFVDGLPDSPGSRHLASSVAQTANALGIAVHATLPANAALRDWLQDLGITIVVERPAVEDTA